MEARIRILNTRQVYSKCFQVMCREELSGRHYWEVDWSNTGIDSVSVGVMYKSISRSDNSSADPKSWVFLIMSPFYFCIHIEPQKQFVPSAGISRIGVFLDWPAGTVSFYKVYYNTLTHLHTFYDTFTEPLFAAFFIGTKSSYITLRPLN
ncbi:neoverrucotoxin subunit beta-like [Sphaeramia orbicularis]|uniref:neoverrucotoxin subunit beta-like n=1 Tax=Sphaeramia orbicularis TaxID=375764 RepID=UPI00117E31B2|nr:neoverrucotoxin subunit beta-like [Sphaeramia orbicularis]